MPGPTQTTKRPPARKLAALFAAALEPALPEKKKQLRGIRRMHPKICSKNCQKKAAAFWNALPFIVFEPPYGFNIQRLIG